MATALFEPMNGKRKMAGHWDELFEEPHRDSGNVVEMLKAEHDQMTRDAIVHAIDIGGGQTCDIAGVLRELYAAGFKIVRKSEQN